MDRDHADNADTRHAVTKSHVWTAPRTRTGYGNQLLISAMEHHDSATFVPGHDRTLVAIAADISHMAANFVSAMLSCTDRGHRVAIFGTHRVTHDTPHLIDITRATDSSRTNP